MRIRFIVNPASGTVRGRSVEIITNAVREVLSGVAGRFEISAPTSGPGAEATSREARELGYDMVFACGGDGTINTVAGPLVGSDTTLGIVPMGSGNGLAGSLDIPMKVRQAVALATKGRVRRIDVGTVAGRYFYSTAGVGIDAVLARDYNTGGISRSVRGVLPYVPLAIGGFVGYRPDTVTLVYGNSSETISPLILTVANTHMYGGGAVIAPEAVPDDGLLDVVVVPMCGLIRALSIGRRLAGGGIQTVRGYRTFRTTFLEVIRRHASYAHVDGEPFDWGGALEFGIKPNALNVLVPA